jgi:microsomal epoxide hydrolase
MTSIPFSTPPHAVDRSANLTPFSISIPDSDVNRLKTLLQLSHIASPNFENSHDDGYFGIPHHALTSLLTHWQTKYSWREWESALNSIPQYTITITDDDHHDESYTIHFLALFSSNPSAIPIALLHGWPGSVVEFLPLLQHARSKYETPEALPYHIIVSHFVGYGFSSPPPLDRDFTHRDNARLLAKLMRTLGFEGYVAQGGDLGGATAPVVSSLDEACRLVHVNMLGIPPPEGTDVEADM